MDFQSIKERLLQWRDNGLDKIGGILLSRTVAIVLAIYLVIAFFVGIYWSMVPAIFSVKDNAVAMAEAQQRRVVTGLSLIHI